MRRWYPVANLTEVRMATIYEQYQPGKSLFFFFQLVIVYIKSIYYLPQIVSLGAFPR